jgi:outer membrane protein OmpA-like peptidoglycan-associated protein
MQFLTALSRVIGILGTLLLISCQPALQSNMLANQRYLAFEPAIDQLSHGLMNKLQQRRGFFSGKQRIVFNPFLDVDNGQVLQVSLQIEHLFFQQVRDQFKNFTISRLTPANLKEADYIVNGLIKYQANRFQTDKESAQKKYYRISASIIDLKTKTIVTQGIAWVVSSGLDYNPTPSYEDNPMYVKGKMLQYIENAVESPIGTQVDTDYYVFIETKALLVEAQTAYDNGNYGMARQLFEKILDRPGGEIIEVYGGLYTTYFKLGDLVAAEENFGKMVEVGVAEKNLPIKLLFQSNLTEFLEIPTLRQQYEIWLRQISLYLKSHSNKCVYITGHTSIYGVYDYNKRLSKYRAEKIQEIMSQTFAGINQRAETIGKGPDEVIVGTTPDSAENAIDRRVEFKIVDC